MKATEEEMNYSKEKIVEMLDWHGFAGFTGEVCSDCKRTANVLGNSPGWFCVCGHFNTQSYLHNRILHENPDLGPSRDIIKDALSHHRLHVEIPKVLDEGGTICHSPSFGGVALMSKDGTESIVYITIQEFLDLREAGKIEKTEPTNQRNHVLRGPVNFYKKRAKR